MKPRLKPIVIPETSSRYWVVQHALKGGHHFKHPYYGVGAQLLVLSNRFYVDPATDERPVQEKAVHMLPYNGAVIGACWSHKNYELESVFPLGQITDENLLAYGRSVVEELQEQDYSLLDIIDLFGSVMGEMVKRQSLVEMAQDRVGFSAPPSASSTSN